MAGIKSVDAPECWYKDLENPRNRDRAIRTWILNVLSSLGPYAPDAMKFMGVAMLKRLIPKISQKLVHAQLAKLRISGVIDVRNGKYCII